MIVGSTARDTARLFRHFFAAYPARSTLVLFALTAAAMAEGAGIAALLPLINLVIDAEAGGGLLMTLYVEQRLRSDRRLKTFPWAGCWLLIVVAIGAQVVVDAAGHGTGGIRCSPCRDGPPARRSSARFCWRVG